MSAVNTGCPRGLASAMLVPIALESVVQRMIASMSRTMKSATWFFCLTGSFGSPAVTTTSRPCLAPSSFMASAMSMKNGLESVSTETPTVSFGTRLADPSCLARMMTAAATTAARSATPMKTLFSFIVPVPLAPPGLPGDEGGVRKCSRPE